MVAAYVAQAPDFDIENGVVCVKAISQGKTLCWHLPLLEFRRAAVRAANVLREHDTRGDVVPFKKDGDCEHD